MTVDCLKAASKAFSPQTSQLCHFHPILFAEVSEEGLVCLAMLLNKCETAEVPPQAKASVLVTNIPKKDGGKRPIMLFRALFRLWATARARDGTRP